MERYNILCLDDEKIVLTALKRELELNQAYHVTVSDSPTQALSLAEENYYDAYLVDQHMPGMDGVTFVNKLKDIDKTPLVFFITGLDTDGKAFNASLPENKDGGAYYFPKPWNESLYIGLAQALKHRQEKKRLDQENQKLNRWVKDFFKEATLVHMLSEKPNLESKLDLFFQRLLEREQVEEVDIFLLSDKHLEVMRSSHLRGSSVPSQYREMAGKAMIEGPILQKAEQSWKYFQPFGIKEKKIGLTAVQLHRIDDEVIQFIDYIIYQGGIMLEQELVQIKLNNVLKDLKATQMELIETEKSAFLSSLARWLMHNINSILRDLKGDADLIKIAWHEYSHTPEVPDKIDSLTSQVANSVPAIDNSIQRLIQMIDNFRFIADICKAKTKNYELNHLIHLAVKNFTNQKKIRSDKVKIVENYEKNLGLVELNQELIARMLEGLLNKAFEALAGKGGEIEIRTRKYSDRAEIIISDSGTDCSPNERQWLKEPLFSTKTPLEAAGMELIIVKEAVNFHHGEIVVSSQEGQGSTVRVRLPFSHVTTPPGK